MFLYPSRKAQPTELVGPFTPEQTVRIMVLRGQFHTYPDCFKFDIDYRRLEFARWLVIHGYLDEWSDSPVHQPVEELDLRGQQCPACCA